MAVKLRLTRSHGLRGNELKGVFRRLFTLVPTEIIGTSEHLFTHSFPSHQRIQNQHLKLLVPPVLPQFVDLRLVHSSDDLQEAEEHGS